MAKIIYLSNSIIPSSTANSIHVMKMCQAFANNGNEVILLTPKNPNIELDIEDIYQFYGVEKCFTIKKLPWLNIKGNARIYGLLAALLAKFLQPDLTYGRCLQSCFFCSVLNLPVAYESHTLLTDVGNITKWMFSQLINSQSFQGLVVISQALLQAYQKQYNIPEFLITIAHDGADESKEGVAIKFENTNKLQIGYLGHLYPGKAMEIIVELAKVCKWANFHIIGGTESHINYWKNQLIDLENIFFYGFIPHSKTDIYRNSFDVLIAPYQRQVSSCGGEDISQWMSPLKIFEYMAAGKAIVASDLPVLREVLSHEINALLFPPEDIKSWIQGLTLLHSQPQLRESLGMAAKKEFQLKYSWQKRAANILNSLKIPNENSL